MEHPPPPLLVAPLAVGKAIGSSEQSQEFAKPPSILVPDSRGLCISSNPLLSLCCSDVRKSYTKQRRKLPCFPLSLTTPVVHSQSLDRMDRLAST